MEAEMSRSTEDELEPMTDERYFALEDAWVEECCAKDAELGTNPVQLYLPAVLVCIVSVSFWLGKALFHV
jgi:hypothetical protein